jgi:hypothetical protein
MEGLLFDKEDLYTLCVNLILERYGGLPSTTTSFHSRCARVVPGLSHPAENFHIYESRNHASLLGRRCRHQRTFSPGCSFPTNNIFLLSALSHSFIQLFPFGDRRSRLT